MAVLPTAMKLAGERRFAEAAECAMEAATELERLEPRSRRVYEAYASAGKFFHLSGQPRPGMDAFEKCMVVFESVLAGQANVNFVFNHVATWPELFTRAALTALDAGEPGRAVEFAESGRSRVMGALAAPRNVPRGVDAVGWHAYVRGWRRLAIRLATLRQQVREPAREDQFELQELAEMRRRLLDQGVDANALRPVSDSVPLERALHLLRVSPVPTTIAYAITLDQDILRLVAIDVEGTRQIDIPSSEQGAILATATQFRLETAQAASISDINAALERLLGSGGAILGAVLRKALRGRAGGRLLWIPHGPLVMVPVAALPWDEGALNDHVAIQVAPSLAMAVRASHAIENKRGKSAYIEGPWKLGQAPTAGGATLLHGAWKKDLITTEPASFAQLAAGLAGRTLALFSCHGVFHWNDPSSSYLQLGFDCGIDDLVGSGLFEPRSMAVLNTCDAGTVVQDETNEAVGLPIAMLSAGAATIVGPSAPIASVAAVAFTRAFLQALEVKSSPEAVQEAIIRMRAMTKVELSRMLEDIGHPFAQELTSVNPGGRIFNQPAHWAFFVHWGNEQNFS